MRATYYEVCPDCGAHLDPGEHCDCSQMTAAEKRRLYEACCKSAAHTYPKRKGAMQVTYENGY